VFSTRVVVQRGNPVTPPPVPAVRPGWCQFLLPTKSRSPFIQGPLRPWQFNPGSTWSSRTVIRPTTVDEHACRLHLRRVEPTFAAPSRRLPALDP